MKEFIEKLIDRLNELANHYEEGCNSRIRKGLCGKAEDCGRCAFMQSIEIVQELEKEYKGGWIPCSERLPEYTDEYLVTIDGANSTTTLSYDEVLCEWFNDECNVYPVIAWQPLPAPYEENRDGKI